MGLDMYLKADKYIGGWEHSPEEERAKYKQIMSTIGLDQFECDGACPSLDVTVTAMYWRKANAIHKWFVDNIQKGIDECQRSYVDRDRLVELRDICREALAKHDASLLPPQGGFFFGSTDIDEGYWQDIIYTELGLTKLLDDARFECFEFHYRSSW